MFSAKAVSKLTGEGRAAAALGAERGAEEVMPKEVVGGVVAATEVFDDDKAPKSSGFGV